MSFLIAALATAGLAVVWFWSVCDHPAGEHVNSPIQQAPAAWRRLFANRSLMLLTLAYFALNYFEYIFFYWIYYYLGEVRLVGLARSATYTTIIFLTMGIMMPLGGWISDCVTRSRGAKSGRRAVPMIGMTLGAVLLYAGTIVPGTAAAVISLSLAIGFASWCEDLSGPAPSKCRTSRWAPRAES